MNYVQGSEWRKWDLLVHTPASIYHSYPGTEQEAWDSFLADIEALPPEFKAIGINDYLFLDGYKRILEERKKGRLSNIDLMLPVIELRLDKFAGHDSKFQRVNFHIIFDAIDPEIIETQFINLLSRDFKLLPKHENLKERWSAIPTRKSLTDFGQRIIDAAPEAKKTDYGNPLHEGFNNFNVTLENILKALDSTYFLGKHITAVGKTEWDGIQWNKASVAEKRNVVNNAHIVFTASESVATFQKAHNALKEASVNNRLFDCSDAHALAASEDKDRIGNCFTWIKADTTFEGLLHAINEYPKRVFVGDIPEKVSKTRTNPTKYVTKIQINKAQGATLTEPWFDFTLPINRDLVAIIGNKGSGKSALADTLGLLGNTKQSAHFSFLNTEKFRSPRNNKASHFQATLTWQSGDQTTKRLDVDPEPNSVETIKYLPQNYIETLCNEIQAGGEGQFDLQLKEIIFSRVSDGDRLGHATLDSLLHYLTSETQSTIRVLNDRIHGLNDQVSRLEDQVSQSNRAQLTAQLASKREELAAHDRSKPEPVPEPAQSSQLKKAAEKILADIAHLKEALDKIEIELTSLTLAKGTATKKISVIDRSLTRLDNFRLQYEELKRALGVELSELELDPPLQFDDVVTLAVNRTRLTELRASYSTQLADANSRLNATTPGSPAAEKAMTEAHISRLQDSLDEPNRRYVAYQDALDQWTKKRSLIQGAPNVLQSISWLEQRLAGLENIPTELQSLRDRRLTISRQIYKEIRTLAESYKRLYQPVQEFIERQKVAPEAIPLTFEVSIVEDGFARTFLEKINRQVKGTFAGLEESNNFLRGMLRAVDFNNEESTAAFLDEIDDCLHFDRRASIQGKPPVQLKEQTRKGDTPTSVYDYIYSLSYLIPRYTLHYGGREINQLSPGERGLLLLVFYLLIDNDDIPLVVDQPEENLDNQTIYDILVRCLADAKRRRQVVIVTHNPNLAVVCDAEQVVHARRNLAVNSIGYDSGAIENPDINRHIINVLEGTRPAFDNRDSKYFVET